MQVKKASRANKVTFVLNQLAQKSQVEMHVIMASFEMPDFEPFNIDPWDLEVMLSRYLVTQSDKKIEELFEYFGGTSELAERQDFTDSNAFQIFVSFQSDNKKIAQELADFLSSIGLKTFISVTDIKVGEQYHDVIQRNLRSSSAMVCLIGQKYAASPICNQEVGWALSQKTLILPYLVSPEVKPEIFGFIQLLQFEQFNGTVPNLGVSILDKLIQDQEISASVLDSLVTRFGRASTFDDARNIWSHIRKFDTVDDFNLARISGLREGNSQIHGANQGKLPQEISKRLSEWRDA
jgi:hypothetical protein